MKKLQITNYKLQKGITIVELLVYMALMSIFLLVLLDIFTTTLNAKLSSESTAALSQDTRYILSKLTYDINNANSVVTPASLGSSASTLEITTGGVSNTYSLNGNGDLNLSNGSSTMKLNGNDTVFTNLTFTRLGNIDSLCTPALCKPTIKVLFTIKSRIVLQGDRQEEQTINTTIGTR